MSRIGKNPIALPAGVKVALTEGSITVEGPLGKLTQGVHQLAVVAVEDNVITVNRKDDSILAASVHGLTRTLIDNMVTGVTKGFEKRLEIVGVGYRAALKGKDIDFSLGFSHPVVFVAPEGITFEVPTQTEVVVKGIDKQLVGQVAANIRKLRKPEPYKGKGIRYKGERIVRKAGKTGKK